MATPRLFDLTQPDVQAILAELLGGGTPQPGAPTLGGSRRAVPSSVLTPPLPMAAPPLPLAPRRPTLAGDAVPAPLPPQMPPPAATLAGEDGLGQTPPSATPPARGPFRSQQLPPDFRSQEPPAPFPSVDDLRAGFVPAPPITTPQGIGPWQTTVTPEADANAVAAGKMPSSEPPTPPPGIGYAMPERTGVGEDRLMAPTPPPTTPPPGSGGGPPMRREPSLWDYIDTALAGMAGGSPVLSRLGDQFAGRNATYDAVLQRGATPELARAIAMNPQQFATVLPSLFSPRTAIVNNRLVETTTGRLIADFSDQWMPTQPGAGAMNKATGEIRAGTGRPLSAQDIERLGGTGDSYANLRRLTGSFRTAFSMPNTVWGGDIRDWLARNAPVLSTRTGQEAATWWQDYRRNSELIERHGLFGAALTGPELASWRAADINPNMAPQMIERNLATRQQIMEGVMRRRAQALVASGYDPNSVAQAFGVAPGALGLGGGGGGQGGAGDWTDIAPGIRIRPVR